MTIVTRASKGSPLTHAEMDLNFGQIYTKTGSLTFSGSALRIFGDFSNVTQSDRLLFQSSTTNGYTNVGAIPNGTGTLALWTAFSSNDPTNASVAQLGIDSSIGQRAWLSSAKNGTGAYLPLALDTGGTERMRIDTNGNVGVGTSSDLGRLNYSGTFNAGTVGSRPSLVGYGAYGGGIGLVDGSGTAGMYAQSSGGTLVFFTGLTDANSAAGQAKMVISDTGLSYKNYSVFRASVTTGATSSITGTPVPFNTSVGSDFGTVQANTATVPKTGWYDITSNIEILNTAGGSQTFRLYLNYNSARLMTRENTIAASGVGIYTFVTRRYLTAGNHLFIEWGGNYSNLEVLSGSEFSWAYVGD